MIKPLAQSINYHDMFTSALSRDPMALRYVKPEHRSVRLCEISVSNNFDSLRYVPRQHFLEMAQKIAVMQFEHAKFLNGDTTFNRGKLDLAMVPDEYYGKLIEAEPRMFYQIFPAADQNDPTIVSALGAHARRFRSLDADRQTVSLEYLHPLIPTLARVLNKWLREDSMLFLLFGDHENNLITMPALWYVRELLESYHEIAQQRDAWLQLPDFNWWKYTKELLLSFLLPNFQNGTFRHDLIPEIADYLQADDLVASVGMLMPDLAKMAQYKIATRIGDKNAPGDQISPEQLESIKSSFLDDLGESKSAMSS